ncbi:hypothetical protein K488DRAFT_74602 [Vararia minispora EC-137]|uniref:Uncharacterized protein n=1 Tax=Vararia minispora EC-137 TaxID=1314806 RepID=A0ACB8Q6I3_9AGAM|nr:hypothetical protein K488DRAFT_74602 [Vararia minispora EC-137]
MVRKSAAPTPASTSVTSAPALVPSELDTPARNTRSRTIAAATTATRSTRVTPSRSAKKRSLDDAVEAGPSSGRPRHAPTPAAKKTTNTKKTTVKKTTAATKKTPAKKIAKRAVETEGEADSGERATKRRKTVRTQEPLSPQTTAALEVPLPGSDDDSQPAIANGRKRPLDEEDSSTRFPGFGRVKKRARRAASPGPSPKRPPRRKPATSRFSHVPPPPSPPESPAAEVTQAEVEALLRQHTPEPLLEAEPQARGRTPPSAVDAQAAGPVAGPSTRPVSPADEGRSLSIAPTEIIEWHGWPRLNEPAAIHEVLVENGIKVRDYAFQDPYVLPRLRRLVSERQGTEVIEWPEGTTSEPSEEGDGEVAEGTDGKGKGKGKERAREEDAPDAPEEAVEEEGKGKGKGKARAVPLRVAAPMSSFYADAAFGAPGPSNVAERCGLVAPTTPTIAEHPPSPARDRSPARAASPAPNAAVRSPAPSVNADADASPLPRPATSQPPAATPSDPTPAVGVPQRRPQPLRRHDTILYGGPSGFIPYYPNGFSEAPELRHTLAGRIQRPSSPVPSSVPSPAPPARGPEHSPPTPVLARQPSTSGSERTLVRSSSSTVLVK